MPSWEQPNLLSSPTALQTAGSVEFSCDVQAKIAAFAGNGVISGCGLTQTGTPDMNVVVAAGWIQIDGILYSVAGGNAAVGSNVSGNPRIDIITVNSSGTITVTAGTAAATPDAPEIPANNIYLGLVYVANGETGLADAEIFNRQIVVPSPSANNIPFTNPILAGLSTAVNHLTGTYNANDEGGMSIIVAGIGGNNVTGWFKTAPSTPYTITAYIDYLSQVANHDIGIAFRESGTGEISMLAWHTNATPESALVRNWNSATSFNANATSFTINAKFNWFRITDDGTNRIYYISADGKLWKQVYTVARTTFLTANQIGFCVQVAAAVEVTARLMSWKET